MFYSHTGLLKIPFSASLTKTLATIHLLDCRPTNRISSSENSFSGVGAAAFLSVDLLVVADDFAVGFAVCCFGRVFGGFTVGVAFGLLFAVGGSVSFFLPGTGAAYCTKQFKTNRSNATWAVIQNIELRIKQ